MSWLTTLTINLGKKMEYKILRVNGCLERLEKKPTLEEMQNT
jgi:hypothetical protein